MTIVTDCSKTSGSTNQSFRYVTWAAGICNYKICYDRFVCFYRKITKENNLLNEVVSSQSAEKEFLVLIKWKTLIEKNCDLLSDLVVEFQQLYEMYFKISNRFRNQRKLYQILGFK